jgi:hypothetical protein
VRTAIRALAFCAALTVGTPENAAADWLFTPFLGRTFLGDTSILDLDQAAGESHWNFGGVVTLLGSRPIGVEGLFHYTPGFFEHGERDDEEGLVDLVTGSRSLALMGNVLLTMPLKPNDHGWRPFVSAGVGLLHASATDLLGVLPVETNLLGYNVGGGAMLVTRTVGLRLDLRYLGNLKPSDDMASAIGRTRLHYWSAGAGVVFRY